MSAQREPEFNDPGELLDEMDALLREQELLRRRMVTLGARYRALQGEAETGRFDKPGRDAAHLCEEYGSLNVKWAAQELGRAATYAENTLGYLRHASADAVKVREYPQPQRKQIEIPAPEPERVRPVVDRRRSR